MRHKGLFTFVIVAFVLSEAATAQSPVPAVPESAPADEEAVMAVINGLFDAMRAGDGEKVRSLFAENAQMGSVVVRDGVPMQRSGSPSGFADAVGQPHDQVWDERIWDVKVHVDGDLASVWTPYAFYLGGTFSHCGANSFLLMDGPDGWKIISIIDTRRKDDCVIPDAVGQQR